MSGWEILTRIWRLHRAVLRDATPCLERFGLVPLSSFVLSKIEEHPTPSELAAAVGVPPPTMSHLLRRLEADGFIRRETDPADLRRFRLSLTEAGRSALQAAHGCLNDAIERYIARLSEREREQLARLLGIILGEDKGAIRT